ncbi:DUF4352 domain-containing protein [Streptomyces sp. NPDC088794]|uniref:DUF4352 domain-containing protein n=1 Tax=Streptomyces sp. NPDC088794 TaxID=3365902 RepID=UPI003812E076
MHTRTTVVAVGLLLTAAATACSNNREPKTVHVTVTQTVTTAPSSEAVRDADHGVLNMGATKTIIDAETDVHATVRALSYQQPYRGPQPQAPEDFQGGDTWATADVKVCNVKGAEFTVDQFPWSLSYSDGTSIEVTGSSGGDMPKPEYPMDKTLTSGRCARGLVTFPVPSSKRPERLVYQPGSGTPTEWAIPKP